MEQSPVADGNYTAAHDVTFVVTMGTLSLMGYLYSALLIIFNVRYRNLR